jgi:predicted site-specific integrase-resolvase
MNKLLMIGAAAKYLRVSTSTLRRWESAGRMVPLRTEGGKRRYDPAMLRPGLHHGAAVERRTIAYARVTSHDQKSDLERQKQVLELYCASQGWTYQLIDGMNYHKLIDGFKAAVREAQCS